jgi:hypothetical protein
MLQNQFTKAGRLLKSKQVVRGFDTGSNSLLVVSDSSDKPHVVTQQQNGKFTCDDCAAYYHSRICAHTLAAAEFEGRLSQFLTWFNVAGHGTNVSRLADFGIDTKKSGKKPNERGKKKQSQNPDFIVHHYDRLQTSNPTSQDPIKLKTVRSGDQHRVASLAAPSPAVTQEDPNRFAVTFLHDHPRVTTCTGCHKKFPRRHDGAPFSPPDDIVVSHRERRTWRDRSGVLQIGKEQAAYFHLNILCIQKGNSKKNSDFDGSQLYFHPIVFLRLNDDHKGYIKRQFQLDEIHPAD